MIGNADETLAVNRPILRSWQFWVGLVVSLVCLGLAVRDVNFGKIGVILNQVMWGWLILAVLSVIVTFCVKALRWQLLFLPDKRPPSFKAFSIQSIGMLLNTFAPARLGDLARAYLLGESEHESKFYVLGTVAVEKLIDLLFTLFIFLLLLSHMVLPDWLTGPFPLLIWGILIGFILVGALVIKGDWFVDWIRFHLFRINPEKPEEASNTGETISRFRALPWRWVNWASSRARFALRSLDVFRQPRQLFWVALWSTVSWLLSALTNYLVFEAIGLKLSIWTAFLLLLVLQIGVAVPSSPGRIGVFHYLTLITLTFSGVENNIALSYGVLLHLIVVGSIGVVGMLCLWWEKVTWSKLAEMTGQFNALVKKVK